MDRIGLDKRTHGVVWSAIELLGYKWVEPVWIKGNSKKDTGTIANDYLVKQPNFPFDLSETYKYLLEIQKKYNDIQQLTAQKRSEANEPFKEWQNRWVDLLKLRFSKVDELIWDGIKHTLDDNGTTICICETGNGSEYRVIGREPEEIIEWMSGVNVPGTNLTKLAYIEEMIVSRIIEYSTGYFGDEVTDISVLDGEILSAAGAVELYGFEPVMNADGKFAGYRLKIKGKPSALSYIKCSFESFVARMQYRIKSLPSMSNDPKVPCYRYIPITKVIGPWDVWDSWMVETFTHSSAKQVFMSWIGATLDASNTGKQALWLHGRGNDGKSKIANALCEYFGNASVVLSGKSMSNQFGGAKLENKRLVVIGDCKNQKVLQSEWAHNLTGGDIADVERKGKDSYTSRLFGKLLICSNLAPEIKTDEINQTARLIYISLRQRSTEELISKGLAIASADGEIHFVGSSEWPKKLKEQLPAFLYACFEMYSQYAPTRSDIMLSKELKQETQSRCSDPESESIEAICEDTFELGDSYIEGAKAFEVLRTKERSFGVKVDSSFTKSAIYSYLYNRFGSEKDRMRIGDHRIMVLTNLKFREQPEQGL